MGEDPLQAACPLHQQPPTSPYPSAIADGTRGLIPRLSGLDKPTPTDRLFRPDEVLQLTLELELLW